MNGLAEPRYGLYVPNFGKVSSARTLADLAAEAEASGWDGFFLWDHLMEWNRRVPLCDSFTALTAMAMSTKRIRIGTTVSPLPRYKPWIVARKTASLDNLSNGRLILGVDWVVLRAVTTKGSAKPQITKSSPRSLTSR